MSLALAPVARPGVPARLAAGAAALLAPQHGRFAPWLAVALGIGVLWYFHLPEEPGWQPLWLVPVLAASGLVMARRWLLAGWLTGLAAALLLGFGAAAWHAGRQPPPLLLPFGAVTVSGLVEEVQPLPEGRRVTLGEARLDGGEAVPRRLRVRLRNEDPARPTPGDRITVRALLRPPGAPAVPGGWDFQRAAYFSGLGGSGFALGPAALAPGQGEGAPPLAGLRARLDTDVAAAIPGPAGAVAAALLSGTQTAIPPAEMQAMRDSGLAHLLSVSGLHMAIVIGVVFAALRALLALLPWVALRVPGKPVAALVALAAGGFYMVLTGSQVPMQRCLGMAALMTLAMLAGRRVLSLRVLAIAAAAVLLAAPAELLGPSFQMSFAAVLALIAGHEALRGRLAAFRQGGSTAGRPWRRVALLVFGLMLTSLLAGAATAPFGLHHFGRLQFYGVLANAVAVPLTSVLVMPAGLLAMLGLPFGLEAGPLWAMGWGTEGILRIARAVAAWPEAAPILPPLPAWGLALASFGFCWLCLWRARLRLLGLPLILGGLGAGLATPPPDLLVSADARIVALRTADGVFLHRLAGGTAFTRDAMLRAMGVASAQPLPESGAEAGGAIRCTPAACRFQPRPDTAAAVLLRSPPAPRGRRAAPPEPAAVAAACGDAVLLVALEPIRPGCAESASIDRFAMWRDGAQAVWLRRDGAALLSDRSFRGNRPWVPPVPLPGRAEALPIAPLDPGASP
jgi:competence protein ComEC